MMLKPIGVLAVGAIAAVSAIDLDAYTASIGGWVRFLGSIAVAAGTIGLYWRNWGKPWKDRAKARFVAFVQEAVTGPLEKTTQRVEAMSSDIATIAEGNAERTTMIKGIARRMDVSDQKLEIVAIKLAASERDSPVPRVWTDAKGEITDCTRGYVELIGVDHHSGRFKGWKQRIYAPERDQLDDRWSEIVAAGCHDVLQFHVYAENDTKIQLVESDVQTLKMNDANRTVFGFRCTLRKIGAAYAIPSRT